MKKEKLDILLVIFGLIPVFTSIIAGVSLVYGFTAGILLILALLSSQGFNAHKMFVNSIKALKSYYSLFAVILLIGASVSIWMASGTVQSLMYYGIQLLGKDGILAVAFIITAVISIFMGTAVGTISTIGIAFIGVSGAYSIPAHIMLGAVVSGAFIADKISPSSGLVNLTCRQCSISYRKFASAQIKTLSVMILMSFAGYLLIGRFTINNIDAGQNNLAEIISRAVMPTPIAASLPLIVVISALLGLRPQISILLGMLSGTIAAIIMQGETLLNILKYAVFGYVSHTGYEAMDSLIHSTGAMAMFEVVMIVSGAIILSTLLEQSDTTARLLRKLIGKSTSSYAIQLKTGLSSLLLTTLTCDQTLGIVLPSSAMKGKLEDDSKLARIISDTGTTIAPIMPWNINAIIILAITGISATSYGPYALLCILSPLVGLWPALFDFIRNNLFKNKTAASS